MLIGPDNVGGLHSRQFFQSPVPVKDFVVFVDDEGGNGKPLQDTVQYPFAIDEYLIRRFSLRDVFQRFDTADEGPTGTTDGRYGEPQPAAAVSQVGEKSFRFVGVFQQLRLGDAPVPFRDGFQGLIDDQIGQAGSFLRIKGAPVLIRPDHIFCRGLAQFFQSAVPVNHVVIETDDEGRDRRTFDDAEELLLAFALCQLCGHAFGDVLQGFNRTDELAAGVADQRGCEAKPAPFLA